MANRVVIDNNRIAVSAPGHDVLTTGYGNMIFDSRLGEFGQVYLTGTAVHSNGVVTVNYGTTLSRVPVVWAQGRAGNTWYGSGGEADTQWSQGNSGNLYDLGLNCYSSTTQARINGCSGYDLIRYVVFTIGS